MNSKLKVAIDIGTLKSGDSIRGIGVYTRELLSALESLQKVGNNNFEIHPVDFFNSQAPDHYDVVHLTRFNPFRISVPFKKPEGTKFVLTIYDLIPLIYPENYPPGVKGWVKWQINKYLIKKNIDTIITISETSKKDICRFIGVNPNKICVTYLAPRTMFEKKNYSEKFKDNWTLETDDKKVPKHFALYVGDINYNKNIPNLVKACREAKVTLVIAGKQAASIDKMNLDHAESKHLKNIDWKGVIRAGFVPDEILVDLYNLADVYIQPSLYEGFGLPLLEAEACGTPIVVSKNQCHVEILGADFNYVYPNNTDSMAKGILNPNVNKKLPREYSWKRTAEETLNVYK